MKIVIAPDSYKGSLSSAAVCEQIGRAASRVFPGCIIDKIPVADGGEGTLESIIESIHGKYRTCQVKNPLGLPISARYGIFESDKAVVEMAQASGLPLIPAENRNILKSSSYGTGQLIADAMANGCRTIYIGLGGSATNDGGIGCLSALGVKFLDKEGQVLNPVPENLKSIETINTSKINGDIQATKFVIMSDVKNPLIGEIGATKMYGSQKGGNQQELQLLEVGMCHYARKLKEFTGVDISAVPGSGAAGGLGAGLIAFLNASIESGIEQILEIVHFQERVLNAQLVITGEGQMDAQSAYGKVVCGIGERCKKNHIPCIALVGGMGEGAENIYKYGIGSIVTTVNSIITLEEAISNAEKLCYQAAERMFRAVRIGMQIGV